MDIEDGIEQIITAYRKQGEERLWDRWLVDYTAMDKETFVSFPNYLKDAMGNKTGQTNVKEILEEAEKIKTLDQKGVE